MKRTAAARAFDCRPLPTTVRELTWANAFAWSRQRVGGMVLWHLHARSDRQMVAVDIAVTIHEGRAVAAQQLRFHRNARATLVRGLKLRGVW